MLKSSELPPQELEAVDRRRALRVGWASEFRGRHVAGEPRQSKGAIVRAGVFLRLLGVSCQLIGAATFVEEGAGAIAAFLSLVRLAATVTVMSEFVLAARRRAGERRLRRYSACMGEWIVWQRVCRIGV